MILVNSMKTTQQIWEDKLWPIRNGVYFVDCTVAMLKILMPWETADKTVSVTVSGLVTLDRIDELREHKKTHLTRLCEQSYDDLELRVVGGEGAHGSAGEHVK